MGKKKTYHVSEHEKQHKRVDIFRTIQVPKNTEQTINKFYPTINEYSNESFVASNTNLPNVVLPNQHRPNKQQTVWSTSMSNINNKQNTKYKTKSTFTNKKSSSKKIIISVCVGLIVFLILLTVIGVVLYYVLFNKAQKCEKDCTNNQFCLLNENKKTPKCACKQGFTNLSNTCEQTSCFMNYFPYTYLNGQSPQTPSSYETKFIKPYCCPNSNYLTSSCCGVSFSNASLQVSKRIIGGNILSQGVFPWIVYITQVYRSSSNSSLQMIKNCSGTLLNELYVLTAAHCVEIEKGSVNFNTEFSSTESIMRVYFGFTDKSKAFQPNVIQNYERKIQRVIVHPKYDPMYLLNDLAILKLDKPIYRSANVDYLCLFDYDKTDQMVSQLKLYTAGWGSTVANHLNLFYPNVINYVDAIAFPMTFCKYIYPEPDYDFLFNSTTHVCAGYQQSAGKDTCYADSGSPLMVQLKDQWFAYGVVSFGSQPDCAKGPSMFVRLAFHSDWIKLTIY